MTPRSRRRLLAGAAGLVALAALAAAGRMLLPRRAPSTSAARDRREDAYRANNLGVALLEQFDTRSAVDAFRTALRLDPALSLARLNLSIALLYTPDFDAARREAAEAARALPGDPRPPYVVGLVARAEGRPDEARAAFERVAALDPRDVGTHVNLGQIDLEQQRYPDAIARFRAALAGEPFNVTAAYDLGLALTRAGQRDEGRQAMELSQTLRAGGYGTVFSNGYLEQGRYAEAVSSTGAEPELVDAADPDVRFVPSEVARVSGAAAAPPVASPFGRRFSAADLADDGRAIVESLSGGITLFDFDRDGDLDAIVVWAGGLRLLRNDGGVYTDVTGASGLGAVASTGGVAVVAGDYDNDGLPDVLVVREGGSILLHNDGGGRFSDATARARLPGYPFLPASAAFVDFDHDGDLDIVVAGLADLRAARARAASAPLVFPDEFPPAPLQLVRNNGNGTFTDITAQTAIALRSHAIAVVPTDYDNRRDVDLLVATASGRPALFQNVRDGTFRDAATEAGLQIDGPVTSVATADFNKDGFPDFFFGRGAAPGVFAASDGHGRFTMVPAPAASAGATAAAFLDYDNDGLLDLVIWSGASPRLFRQSAGGWREETARAFPSIPSAGGTAAIAARSLVAADVDGDGDTDLVTLDPSHRIAVWRNEGGNRNRSLRVAMTGRASNRAGIGSKIDVRAGSLRQRLETSAATPAAAPADVLFGLGARTGADVVRVLWPSGILQSETPPGAAASGARAELGPRVSVEELDRKPSSCPFLFAWNGHRFVFVTDFMGAGEMGYLEAPGVRNHPNPVEYVRIREDQLRPKDGRYELRVTNELEETAYVDRLQLVAVSHPSDVELFPNEGMSNPPKPPRLFGVRGARPPDQVVDEHGHDVTTRLARIDGLYADDFALAAIRGYAGDHTLTIELGPAPPPEILLLNGWTDYSFSTDNLAAAQAGLVQRPPSLLARGPDARWRRIVEDIGIPVGRPQTVVVDLRGRLPAGTTALRVDTNMRVYWDQIRVASVAPDRLLRVERLDPDAAVLRPRGFSAEIAAAPPQPTTYEYERVSGRTPWKAIVGRYTRFGDVRPLVTRADDRFVVSAPGDEIALWFDAGRLAPLAPGSRRTFLLYADGFSKEMDLHSASPDGVEPLPLHGMARYPDAADAARETPDRRRYREEYNTRRITAPLPSIDLPPDASRFRRRMP